MLHGTVKYGLKAGGEASVDWAAYARLVKEEGKVKMEFYQVYLVSRSGDYALWDLLMQHRILLRKISELSSYEQVEDRIHITPITPKRNDASIL